MTTATQAPPAPTWDLESIFPGGCASSEYRAYREQVKDDLAALKTDLDNLPKTIDRETVAAWKAFALKLSDVSERVELVASFATCQASADVDDTTAASAVADADGLDAEESKLMAGLDAMAAEQSDEAWLLFVGDPEIEPFRFLLDKNRMLARAKMPRAQEELALDLGVDGYQGWNRVYDKMSGDLRADFADNGQSRTFSLGQLSTKLADPDRGVRKQAFDAIESAWESRAGLAAMTLNSLAGFRLALYRNRGWDDPRFEALQFARLQPESLDSMWRVINTHKSKLADFINAKKRLLSIDDYSWWDEWAPVGASSRSWPYDEAADFIVEQTRTFSPDLSQFCRMAIDRRWIEAEDRPGKRGGGYCTGLGPKKESRIFMTYANTYENLLTLAHELGHAYHSWLLNDQPYFATWYPMTLAETASIFTESLVTDAALTVVENPAERLFLLDQKIQQAYTMFCNLQCRYIFEQNFYNERATGMVPRERLDELMVAAQREAYGDLLDANGHHKLFWCSKLHFHLADAPFYNYPYVFGYLFAGGVYARAKAEGSSFAPKYAALLADTGRMSSEEVAAKHLDVDLTGETFWTASVTEALSDIDDFVNLAREVG